MRFLSPRIAAVALALSLPLFAATARETSATAAVHEQVIASPSLPAPAAENDGPCGVLRGDADEGRFACAADGEGGRWAVRLDAPVPGARDLTLTAIHVDARGTETPFTARVEGAAAWWYTIAPVDRAVAIGRGGELTVDLARVGFQTYPLGHFAFRAWRP